jgi:hypothetical protein
MTPAAVKFCYWLASCPAWSRGWGFGTSVAKAIFPYCKEARRLPNFSLSQTSRYGSELQDRESLVQTGSTKHLDFLSRRIFGLRRRGPGGVGSTPKIVQTFRPSSVIRLMEMIAIGIGDFGRSSCEGRAKIICNAIKRFDYRHDPRGSTPILVEWPAARK